eukprot:scaffold12862_cov55-Attheya_sp.AAC.3
MYILPPRHHHDTLSRCVLLARRVMPGHFLAQERIVRRMPQRMLRGILERPHGHGRIHPKQRLRCQKRHL